MGLLKEVMGIRRLRVFKYLKRFPRTDKDTRDELGDISLLHTDAMSLVDMHQYFLFC